MPSPVPAQVRVRFKLLDGLRFFAAMAVISYHYVGFNHSHWGIPPREQFPFLSQIAAYGALGVQLFFIISGFVILMSMQGRSVKQFVTSRVARLFPAYWVAVLAGVLLSTVIATGQFKELSLGESLMNLTMVQTSMDVPHVDGVFWTLWVELLFYVMVCGLIMMKPTEGKIMAFAFLWPLTAAMAQLNDAKFVESLLSPLYAPLFAGGMALYLIHAYGHSLGRWLLVAFNAILASEQTSTNFVMHTMQKSTKQDLSATAGVVIVLLFFVVVALITVTPLRGRGPAWLTYAGALTYPVYLVHEIWGWWIISWANPALGKWVALFMAVCFSLICAALIERYVERPLRPVIARKLFPSTEPGDSGGSQKHGRRIAVPDAAPGRPSDDHPRADAGGSEFPTHGETLRRDRSTRN